MTDDRSQRLSADLARRIAALPPQARLAIEAILAAFEQMAEPSPQKDA